MRNAGLKLIDPLASHHEDLIDLTLDFIDANYPGVDLPAELLPGLRSLYGSGRIKVKAQGAGRSGGYNRLLNRITLNSDRLGFLKRDFRKQLRSLEGARHRHILDQHTRAVLELSGILIHEGAHALCLAWRRKADEAIAFECEQKWYAHLYGKESEFRRTLLALARAAEYDAENSPEYKGLRLSAPVRIAFSTETKK